MKHYRPLFCALASVGLLWLSCSVGWAQEGGQLELDPADPVESDLPGPIQVSDALSIQAVNPRFDHITYSFVFRNNGSGLITRLEVYAAIPANRDNQIISGLTFSQPVTELIDKYGQRVVYFRFDNLAAGQQATASWSADAEIRTLNYGVDPNQVAGLDQIPADIRSVYTRNESMYRLDSAIIQEAARTAAAGATNPYWLVWNIHDFVANRLTYVNDHQWDDAETVYLQQHGSCTEYTYLFMALSRANGLPTRYAGGSHRRADGVYVDTVFHRWAEVYLPPYGWVPVDVTWDDGSGGPSHTYFGAIADSLLTAVVGGGNSEYLGWDYLSSYHYHYSGQVSGTRERSVTWSPYPSELRSNPTSLSALALSGTARTIAGRPDIVTTNGAYGWSVDSMDSWLQLDKASGTTPDAVQVTALTSGLGLGTHTGQVTLRSDDIGKSATIPVQVLVVDEIFSTYLPVATRWR